MTLVSVLRSKQDCRRPVSGQLRLQLSGGGAKKTAEAASDGRRIPCWMIRSTNRSTTYAKAPNYFASNIGRPCRVQASSAADTGLPHPGVPRWRSAHCPGPPDAGASRRVASCETCPGRAARRDAGVVLFVSSLLRLVESGCAVSETWNSSSGASEEP